MILHFLFSNILMYLGLLWVSVMIHIHCGLFISIIYVCICSEAGMSPTALSDNGGTTINEILHETAKYE